MKEINNSKFHGKCIWFIVKKWEICPIFVWIIIQEEWNPMTWKWELIKIKRVVTSIKRNNSPKCKGNWWQWFWGISADNVQMYTGKPYYLQSKNMAYKKFSDFYYTLSCHSWYSCNLMKHLWNDLEENCHSTFS